MLERFHVPEDIAVRVPQEDMRASVEDIFDKIYFHGDATGRTLSTKVEIVEPMGAEKYLYLSAKETNFVARVNSDNEAQVNQEIDVVFKLENAKFFDPETNKVIS